MIDQIVGMLAPEDMTDIRSLPPELQETAVSELIGKLDNTGEIPYDDPSSFCTDWLDGELRRPGTLLALLNERLIETPSDVAEWLQERAALREARVSVGDHPDL
jgi:hypothetical protein